MSIDKKKLTLTIAALLGVAWMFGLAGTVAAQGTDPSSACIKCHTDFEQMDAFGAASASSAAGIAG